MNKRIRVSIRVNVQSLCGHTSPVESLAFDSAEVLVLAGASTGVIKLWDLEETKRKSLISAQEIILIAPLKQPVKMFSIT